MNDTKWSQDLYQQTYEFAAAAHNDQKVPGSDLPYITHVTLVSMELLAAATECDDVDFAMQCSLLHDVLEDTSVAYDDVVSRFGRAIAEAVSSLTKDRTLPKHDQIAESLTRVKAQPRDVWRVKLADRITNLRRPPTTWQDDKKARYRQDAILICDVLGPASDILSKRLRTKIEEYAGYIESEL